MTSLPASGEVNRELAGQVRPVAWWGMIFFIITEGTFFALLLTSYFYLRENVAQWPPTGIGKPELLVPSINTVILLASSVPMFWATSLLNRGRVRMMALALGLSWLLGALFLGIQVWEFSRLSFDITDQSYGSIFWLVSGFHGAHLTVGLVFVAYILLRTAAGHFGAERRTAVENVALYWHFVDAIWIAVFLTLHIAPHLLPRTVR